jgi:hypothetical protein
MSTEPQPEKKIIIDEGWKSQVEAERKAATQPQQPPAEPAAETSPGLPPPGLSYLVSTLYLQGAIALGLYPDPMTHKAEVRLGQAKYAIDTLAVLQQKTEGNRTPEESEEIEAVLYQLRMAFVEIREHGLPPAETPQ